MVEKTTELTDNDIIKALGHCSKDYCHTSECPVFNGTTNEDCRNELIKSALDLISRQKVEIERLQELVDDMGDYFPACINCEGKTEIGERTDKCVYLIDNTNYCIKRGIANIAAIRNENLSLKEQLQTARAEAITEFEDRLNGAKFKQGYVYIICADDVSKIAKEMKEGVNNA